MKVTKFDDFDNWPNVLKIGVFGLSGELQKMGRGCVQLDDSMLMRLV